jgi:DNA-binding transcriptional LysR family regulator
MNFEDLEVFRAIAFSGSLSRAGQSLNLSQPTITRRLQNLEQQLGTTLVDRSLSPVHLTPQGILLLEFSQSVFTQLNDLKNALNMEKTISGTINVATSTVHAKSLVLPQMAKFLRQYPEVQVRVSVMDSTKVLAALRTENADVGFVGMEPDSGQWDAESIGEDEIVLVVPDIPGFSRLESPLYLEFLKDLPFVQREFGSGTWDTAMGELKKRGFTAQFRVVCQVDSNEAVVQTVATGIGVGFASQTVVRLVGPRNVRTVTLEGGPVRRTLYVVTKSGNDLSEAANLFIRFVKSAHIPTTEDKESSSVTIPLW